MAGWPSPRRKEESYRHVQRVCAALGAQASQNTGTISTESLLEDPVALTIVFYIPKLALTALT